eukprot:635918-Amphidinium_carterae.2
MIPSFPDRARRRGFFPCAAGMILVSLAQSSSTNYVQVIQLLGCSLHDQLSKKRYLHARTLPVLCFLCKAVKVEALDVSSTPS